MWSLLLKSSVSSLTQNLIDRLQMNKKILIVDDDVDILDALQLLLQDKGYKVKVASNGKYAESLIKGNKDLPDLIVLDIMLGEKDGRIICKKLKVSSRTKHIPIILVSAHPDSKQSSFDAKASAFIAKPFESEFLLKTIANYLS